MNGFRGKIKFKPIDTFCIGRTWPPVSIELALVDVFAAISAGWNKSCWTKTGVPTRLVFARLLRTTNGFPRNAFVNIETLSTICIKLEANLACEWVRATIAAVRVYAFLGACTRIAALAFINIWKFHKIKVLRMMKESRKFFDDRNLLRSFWLESFQQNSYKFERWPESMNK